MESYALQILGFPEEVGMAIDKRDYVSGLTEQEKLGYDRALAQLIFMRFVTDK